MKLPYERLAYYTLGMMITTLLLATNAPSQHSYRTVDYVDPVPQGRCTPPLDQDFNTTIRAVIDSYSPPGP